jgi:pimeloyl-ACP methyl ester carboxylesterase
MTSPANVARAARRSMCGAAVIAVAALVGAAAAFAAAPADAAPSSAASAAPRSPAAASGPASVQGDSPLSECHVAGIRNGVLCGTLQRPLDPAHRERAQIAIHYVVVPAMARRKFADPVFLLAGGPGQSAVAVAAPTMALFSRLNNRRDIVFVDQRGTGGSAPLQCEDPEHESLAEQADPERQVRLATQCKAELLKLPYVRSEDDLRFFTTSIAVQDLDAVRRALGAEQIDLVGASYGTRVALEYQRQFPAAVRRSVIDGVAPPDMALPASFSLDNQSALDGLLAACAAEPGCARDHPALRANFASLLASLPRTVKAAHPLTGRSEEFVLGRDMLLGAVRNALYVPSIAAALPAAIDAAQRGEFTGLVGLNSTFAARKATRIATGMHLSVVCAEDVPRVHDSADRPGSDFGTGFARFYGRMCAQWPRGDVPPAFYAIAASPAPVLVLSGGLDPATPPRHGERVAHALGPKARHVVVANAGHGVLGIGCMRDVVYRFIDATSDRDALAVDAGCVANVPRPPAFRPIGSDASGGPPTWVAR